MYVTVEGRVCRWLGSRGLRVRERASLMFQGEEADGNIDRLGFEEVRRGFGTDMPWGYIRLKGVWRRPVGKPIWELRRSILPLGWGRIVRMD